MARSLRTATRRRVIGTLFAVGALVVAACSGDDTAAPTTTPPGPSSTTATSSTTTVAPSTTESPTTTDAPTTTRPDGGGAGIPGVPRLLPPFAAYSDVPLPDDARPYAGRPTPSSLDGVRMQEWLRQRLDESPEIAERLAANGFAVVPGQYPFFHSRYQSLEYAVDTVYVTTDAVYHTWHLAFAKVLRDTEDQRLALALDQLLTGLVDAARDQAAEVAGGPLADAADRVAALYEAAAVLRGLDVGTVSAMAEEEVALAEAAAETTTSPVTGTTPCRLPDSFEGCVDYTQLRPRGHYTRSDNLEAYFRALGLLGQEAFHLRSTDGVRMGALASRLVTEDPALLDLWRQVYEPTAFLVGVADDYTPLEMRDAAATVIDSGLGDLAALEDDDTLRAVANELVTARPVGIDPENASVRVMGARLVLDSFLLDQLAWPNVGTEDNRRVNVSPLDLASVFGSPLAERLQQESGQPAFDRYEAQLGVLRELVGGRTAADWAGTVYDAWLYALEPQFAPRGAAYPDIMRTDAWAAKSLQTGLGSYTELKHDTILYSKQGTAGEGEGPPVPDWPLAHTVEPDPAAFGRIAAVARLCRDGLDARDLLTPGSTELLDGVIDLAGWLAGLAADELAGRLPAGDDLLRLRDIGSELELLWFEASDIPGAGYPVPAQDDRAALVADVFRSSFEFLELGTGTIDTVYVLVPDVDGEFQVATGAVYSYYEFWRPVSALRLTDEEWWRLLDDGAAPPRPWWQAEILVDGDVATETRVVQQVAG
jgi:hypothetical protein